MIIKIKYEFIYISLYEICERIASKWHSQHITAGSLGTSNPTPPLTTLHDTLVLMRAPYWTRLLLIPQVVGAGFEPCCQIENST